MKNCLLYADSWRRIMSFVFFALAQWTFQGIVSFGHDFSIVTLSIRIRNGIFRLLIRVMAKVEKGRLMMGRHILMDECHCRFVAIFTL